MPEDWYTKWKELVLALNDDQFALLCYRLVGSMVGFENVDWRETPGPDGGRDLQATRVTLLPNESQDRRPWWFECKRYSDPIPSARVSERWNVAEMNKIDGLVFFSPSPLSNSAKSSIEDNEKNFRCKILDWCGIHFFQMLFSHSHICQEFFSDEPIPVINPKSIPIEELREFPSDLQKRFGINLTIKTKGKVIIDPARPIESLIDVLDNEVIKNNELDLNIKALVCNSIGGFLAQIGYFDDALRFLEEALRITPSDLSSLLNKGYVLERIGKPKESAPIYNKILKNDAKNIYALNNKANNLFTSLNKESAIENVEKALKIDENFLPAIQTKFRILRESGNFEDALKFIERYEGRIDSRIIKFNKCEILIDLLDFKTALEMVEDLFASNKTDLMAVNLKGVVYEHSSNYASDENKKKALLEKALAQFENSVKINPKFATGYANIATVLMKLNRNDEAGDLLREQVHQFPHDPFILKQLAAYSDKKGNIQDSLNYLENALVRIFDKESLFSKASALIKLDRMKDAQLILLKYQRINDKDPRLWILKGDIYRNQNDDARAKLCYKTAKTLSRHLRSMID